MINMKNKKTVNYMKTRTILVVLCIFLLPAISGCITEEKPSANHTTGENITKMYEGKRILVIDSYNVGVDAFDLKMKGIDSVLNNTGVVLRTIHLDEKKNPDKEFQKQAALNAKSVIESFNPDVIISLDDPAFEYVIMPYYKDSNIPVVFSGVNWDASVYGAPYSNTAGIIEVALTDQLVSYLSNYAKGNRIGLLAGNTTTDRKNVEYYKKLFNISFVKRYHVNTFEEWKQSFENLQNETDYILIENNAGIKNWNDTEAEAFVLKYTRVPAGAVLEYITPYTLIGLTKVTEEHGEWPAQTALRILDGTKPTDIPQVTNKKGKLYVNLKIADKIGIVIGPELLKNAIIIR